MIRRDDGATRRLQGLFEGGSDRDLTDGQLLERFAAGPSDGAERAFAALVERHGPMVLRVARGVLADAHSAQDAFQATFLVLVRRARGLWVRDSIGPWLYQVAHRTASSLRADAARRSRLDELAGAAQPRATAAGSADDDDLARVLHEEIGRLPERYRAPVVLCDLEGRTHEQAARSLGWPIGTVKSRQARARDQLRTRLARRGVDPGLALALLRPESAPFAAASSLIPNTARAAGRLIATRAFDPGPASDLAREVLRSMAITRWSKVVAAVALLGVAASGAALAARTQPSPLPTAPPPAVASEAPPRTSAPEDQPTLIGTVVDEAGRGVAGAEVGGTVRQKPIRATTDAAGGFRVELPAEVGPADRLYGVVHARDSVGRLGIERLGWSRQNKPGEPIRVVLKPGHDLTVTVLDGPGQPVAGAEIIFLAGVYPVFDGRTDAAGRWSGRVPVDPSGWAVVARRGGLGFDYATSDRTGGSATRLAPLPGELTLRLDSADAIRVRVVDPAGRPLAGVRVGPWTIQKPAHAGEVNLSGLVGRDAVTGPDGTAVIDWLPAHQGKRQSVLVHREGYTHRDNAQVVEPGASGREVTVTLLPLERLAGRVREADGRPAPSVLVEARGVGSGYNNGQGAVRTDADGNYAMTVAPDQAYVVAASRGDQAAPDRSGVVVRLGKPTDGIDLTLTRTTTISGRVTIGPDDRPAPETQVVLRTRPTSFPEELRPPGDQIHHSVEFRRYARTDASGRYEFHVGPGDYDLFGPPRVELVALHVPAADAPAAINRDLRMPRPEVGPLALKVVDSEGRPFAGAVVEGNYASGQATRWFKELTVGADGSSRVERSLDPLVLLARSLDGRLKGVLRSEAEATEAVITLWPTTTAEGFLLDSARRPVAGRPLKYGIRIHDGPAKNSPFMDAWGGTVTTDDSGYFRLADLVVSQRYHITFPLDTEGSSRNVTDFVAAGLSTTTLGNLTVDTEPIRPYVPPTPAERAEKAFRPASKVAPADRLSRLRDEARRESTRPLIVIGRPDGPAVVDLFRLLDEQSDAPEAGRVAADNPACKPGDLRWEFELLALDTARGDDRAVAQTLGIVGAEGPGPATLAALDDSGKLVATYPLTLGSAGTLDGAALTRFLLAQKLPTRDAEALLADGLKRAKAEGKRVLFVAGASWCGPCRLLARFLDKHRADLEPGLVVVALDVDRDRHGRAVDNRLRRGAGGGVPWFAVLDEAGQPVGSSTMPDQDEASGQSNIGYPSTDPAISHFADLLRRAVPGLPASTVEGLAADLRRPR